MAIPKSIDIRLRDRIGNVPVRFINVLDAGQRLLEDLEFDQIPN